MRIPVCANGHAVFPARALCPHCGSREWTERETGGVVEELTEREGVRIASVRTDLGPIVIARVSGDVACGAAAALEADGGVPVARKP